MSIVQLRREVKEKIDGLSPARLRSAAELINSLEEFDAATTELLQIPGLIADVRAGLKDIRAGRTTPAEKLRRKY